MSMFDVAFDRVVSHEGGFQDDPGDRGNWTGGRVGKGECKGTNFGISAMSYPELDIEGLDIGQAREIYYRDWWLALPMAGLCAAMQFQLFDAAVNHGKRNAVRILQRAVGVDDDGLVGPKTLNAVAGVSSYQLVMLFLAERLRFYTDITAFDEYGRGWVRRVANNMRIAIEDGVL